MKLDMEAARWRAWFRHQFSLARMIMPPWDGCISVTDDTGRAYFASSQTPLFSWSSQAHGFFAGFARPDKRNADHLAKCWYSYANLRRLSRAEQFAARLSSSSRLVTPVNIALAYVLAQPFPVYSLIGPRTVAELEQSLIALSLSLSPDDIDWLDLRTND